MTSDRPRVTAVWSVGRALLAQSGRHVIHGLPAPAVSGWADRSLHRGLRIGVLSGAIVFQTLTVLAWTVSGSSWTGAPVVGLALSGAVTLLSVAALRGHAPQWFVAVALYAAATGHIVMADDPSGAVVFTAVWLHYFTDGVAGVLIPGRRSLGVQVVGCVGFAMAVALTHPEWVMPSVEGQLICGLSIILAARLGLGLLATFASDVDGAAAAAASEADRAAWTRRAAREAAEGARLVHDTIVNTLGAIASGGGAVRDPAEVQERCRRDTALLTQLVEGRPVVDDSPVDIIGTSGLTIRRTGLTDEQFRRTLDPLPPATTRALSRCLVEVLQNVSKHAQVRSASVEVTDSDLGLRIEVTDAGVGFDASHIAMRGLRTSVVERAREVGIETTVESAPGAGTSVTFQVPIESSASRSAELDPGHTVSRAVDLVRNGAAVLWATAVVLVGAMLESVIMPGRLTPTYGAFLAGGVGIGAVIVARRRGRRARVAVTVLLVVLIPVGLTASAATSDFGRVDPIGWEVVAHSGLLVLLIRYGTHRGWIVGLAAHLATGVALALGVADQSLNAAAIMLIGSLIGATLIVGWVPFDAFLTSSARRLARDEEARRAAGAEARMQEAASAARARWRDTSLRACRELLAGLGSGSLRPDDPDIRRRCAEEEAHLRQVTQLDPRLVRLSPWIVGALDDARDRGVALVIRAGAVEPVDADEASAFGRFLRTAVQEAPAGAKLTASFFGADEEFTLRLVAEHPVLSRGAARSALPPPLARTLAHHGDQELLEVSV